jgi:putative flippase GtrA
MSSLALLLVGAVSTDPGAAAQTVAIAAANLVATAVRFVAMRRWIFNDGNGAEASSPARVTGLSLGVADPATDAAERQSA